MILPAALWAGALLREKTRGSGMLGVLTAPISGPPILWGQAAACAVLVVPVGFAVMMSLVPTILHFQIQLSADLGYHHLTAAPGWLRHLHVTLPQTLVIVLAAGLSGLTMSWREACLTSILSLIFSAPVLLMMS